MDCIPDCQSVGSGFDPHAERHHADVPQLVEGAGLDPVQ